jgi:hypothetical protein
MSDTEDTYGDDAIECPFCFHVMMDDEYVLDEGVRKAWECEKCERKFEVTKYISATYRARPKQETT